MKTNSKILTILFFVFINCNFYTAFSQVFSQKVFRLPGDQNGIKVFTRDNVTYILCENNNSKGYYEYSLMLFDRNDVLHSTIKLNDTLHTPYISFWINQDATRFYAISKKDSMSYLIFNSSGKLIYSLPLFVPYSYSLTFENVYVNAFAEGAKWINGGFYLVYNTTSEHSNRNGPGSYLTSRGNILLFLDENIQRIDTLSDEARFIEQGCYNEFAIAGNSVCCLENDSIVIRERNSFPWDIGAVFVNEGLFMLADQGWTQVTLYAADCDGYIIWSKTLNEIWEGNQQYIYIDDNSILVCLSTYHYWEPTNHMQLYRFNMDGKMSLLPSFGLTQYDNPFQTSIKYDVLTIYGTTKDSTKSPFRDLEIFRYNLSCCISVLKIEDPLFIFPNPFNSQSTLTLHNVISNSSFELYDLLGELIMRDKIYANSYEIETGMLDKGMYIVRVIGPEGDTRQTKIVMQ